jgi:predicted flap endonuclease-1-like 5' DNA nuclease
MTAHTTSPAATDYEAGAGVPVSTASAIDTHLRPSDAVAADIVALGTITEVEKKIGNAREDLIELLEEAYVRAGLLLKYKHYLAALEAKRLTALGGKTAASVLEFGKVRQEQLAKIRRVGTEADTVRAYRTNTPMGGARIYGQLKLLADGSSVAGKRIGLVDAQGRLFAVGQGTTETVSGRFNVSFDKALMDKIEAHEGDLYPAVLDAAGKNVIHRDTNPIKMNRGRPHLKDMFLDTAEGIGHTPVIPVPTEPSPAPAPGPATPSPTPAPGPATPSPTPAPGPATPSPTPAPGPAIAPTTTAPKPITSPSTITPVTSTHGFARDVAAEEDEFTRIRGINKAYESLLKKSSITTFARLRTATDEELRSIIKKDLDFDAWRKTAAKLSEEDR